MISNKRIGIIFLACAVIIAGAIFTWFSHKRLQIIEKGRANLAAQLATLKTRLRTAEQDREQAQADLNNEVSSITSKDLIAISDAMKARNNAAFEKRMKNDPRFQKDYYQQWQYAWKRPYVVFLAKEHLTPDQIDKFTKALVQREMDKDDLRLTLEAQGLPADAPSGLPIKQQSQEAFQQAIEDIVGPDGYARFEIHDRQSDIRELMGYYAAESDLSGSPMTPDQVEQMVDYIAQNNPDFQKGKAINANQIDWPAVDEQARKIMTPEQYDLFTHTDPFFSYASRWMQKVNQAIDDIGNASKQKAGGAAAE